MAKKKDGQVWCGFCKRYYYPAGRGNCMWCRSESITSHCHCY
jgi:hypothetical protein